ncbi:MAG TPA: hypothetical protein VE954_43240 [Oligoflexus sp.]|uniref:hypothetical protein n=1 Tax=Oligoflexus sp. TaxID=1971216 RepID=UPI002D6BD314|nr:hypothetical protein [Oligoflexus sp.]HYX39960.1 hypothetical protein [Oligoflexus sp.]
MTLTQSRNSGWRVTFTLDPESQLICEMWNQSAEDICRFALAALKADLEKMMGNFETYAVAHYIEHDPRWKAIAEGCDDYKDFIAACKRQGIHETPRGGIDLRTSRKIDRAKLLPLIRSIRPKEKRRAYATKEDNKGKEGRL